MPDSTVSVVNHVPMASVGLLLSILILGLAAYGWNSLQSIQLPYPFLFGVFPISLTIDTLSSVFLALLGLVSFSVCLFSPGYLNRIHSEFSAPLYWISFYLFILAMAAVLISADAITFLIFWELMSFSSAALVATEQKQKKIQEAALIYLVSTRIATAFLATGFLIMHSMTQSWSFANWKFEESSTVVPAIFIIIGFAIKAGIWPFHLWLPYAHPAAPAPVSALMSGVMVKIALYGMIRVLVYGDLTSQPLMLLIFLLGLVSSFWGILFALVQHDLKRLLAYCTVENVGLVMVAIGIAIYGKIARLPDIYALGMIAAIFHCVNHGLYKSLLFLGAGSVDAQARTRDLWRLGGLAKNMPWTTATFLFGSISICNMPPTNGFASKWFVYEGLLNAAWESTSLLDRSVAVAAICVLSIVGGLGIACFTKAVGIGFLGGARSSNASAAAEASRGMISAQIILALACIALGFNVSTVIASLQNACFPNLITAVNARIAPVEVELSALPVFPISQPLIALILASIIGVTYVAFLNRSKVRQYITWECGFGELTARTQATSDSFVQPIAMIFSPILRYTIGSTITGKDRRHFPEQITVEPRIASILETKIYMPMFRVVAFLAKNIAKLQAGSIHLYLLYVCVTLVVLLVTGTRL